MSRFGIRKKLKGLVDGDRGKRQIVTHSITFVLPDGAEKVLEAEDRYNVLMASEMLPSPISTGRRAGGPCPDGPRRRTRAAPFRGNRPTAHLHLLKRRGSSLARVTCPLAGSLYRQ